MKEKDTRAHVSYVPAEQYGKSEAGSSKGNEADKHEMGERKSLVSYTPQANRSNENESIRWSDIDALIKMLKDNGNKFSNSFVML